MYDVIVVGAGFAGTVLAKKFANQNKKVLVIEKRNHIAGNMYEQTLDNGVRIHKYGPHIFHTESKEIYDFINSNCELFFYEHKVIGNIDNKLVPIPFNYKSLEILFSKKESDEIKSKLSSEFKSESKISILDLIKSKDDTVKKFGEYVYEKVFVNYTAKQWDMPIENVDKSVINRVPVILGYDDRYFQDKYQFMPKNGYNEIFNNLLSNDNIDLMLNVDAKELIELKNNEIYYKGQKYNGTVIYTGPLDELLEYKYGALPYRSLKLEFEDLNQNYYQPTSVVNYPNTEKYTRITEFKYFSSDINNGSTTILKEYPLTYNYLDKNTIPYYSIINEENNCLYQKYSEEVKQYNNLYLCGRLAEYKYYNMDAVILRAFKLFEEITGEK